MGLFGCPHKWKRIDEYSSTVTTTTHYSGLHFPGPYWGDKKDRTEIVTQQTSILYECELCGEEKIIKIDGTKTAKGDI